MNLTFGQRLEGKLYLSNTGHVSRKRITDHPGPDSDISSIFYSRGLTEQIATASELRREETYILAMCTPGGAIVDRIGATETTKAVYGHIMITEPRTLVQTPNGLTIKVVEATASGERKLRSLVVYKFEEQPADQVKKKMFQVKRPDGDMMWAKITRLKVN